MLSTGVKRSYCIEVQVLTWLSPARSPAGSCSATAAPAHGPGACADAWQHLQDLIQSKRVAAAAS